MKINFTLRLIALLFFTLFSSLFVRSQNIGIGTASPAQKLHIAGLTQTIRVEGLVPGGYLGQGVLPVYATGSGDLTVVAPASLPAGDWSITGNNGIGAANFLGTINAADLILKTSNTEQMRILSSGNVGIGTAAPAQLLDVNGNIKFTGALMPANLAGTVGQFLQSNGAGVAPTWVTVVPGGGVSGSGTATQVAFWNGVVGAASTTLSSSANLFWDNTNGYLGIGTTAPSASLSVGASSQFRVNALGDLSRVNNVPYAWPVAQGAANQVLTNNGAGTLSWVSPTATIANNSYFAYGTSQVTINNVAGNGTFTFLPGLTVTVTLVSPAVIWVHTDGGVQTSSGAAAGFSAIDVVLTNNGALFANGGYERVSVLNNGGVGTVIGFWAKDEIVLLPAGTYTFAVAASKNLGSNAFVSGNNLSVLQGALAVEIFYQ